MIFFLKWVNECDSIELKDIIAGFNKNDCKPVIINYKKGPTFLGSVVENTHFKKVTRQFYSFDQIIIGMINAIKNSKSSLMVLINHPKINKHWIVVDSIDRNKDEVFIRDPSIGSAHKLRVDEFKKYIFDEDSWLKMNDDESIDIVGSADTKNKKDFDPDCIEKIQWLYVVKK